MEPAAIKLENSRKTIDNIANHYTQPKEVGQLREQKKSSGFQELIKGTHPFSCQDYKGCKSSFQHYHPKDKGITTQQDIGALSKRRKDLKADIKKEDVKKDVIEEKEATQEKESSTPSWLPLSLSSLNVMVSMSVPTVCSAEDGCHFFPVGEQGGTEIGKKVGAEECIVQHMLPVSDEETKVLHHMMPFKEGENIHQRHFEELTNPQQDDLTGHDNRAALIAVPFQTGYQDRLRQSTLSIPQGLTDTVRVSSLNAHPTDNIVESVVPSSTRQISGDPVEALSFAQAPWKDDSREGNRMLFPDTIQHEQLLNHMREHSAEQNVDQWTFSQPRHFLLPLEANETGDHLLPPSDLKRDDTLFFQGFPRENHGTSLLMSPNTTGTMEWPTTLYAPQSPAFFSPQWVGNMGEKIALTITHLLMPQEGKPGKLTIQLVPDTLGKVEINVHITPDNRIDAVVQVEQQETYDLFYRDQQALQKVIAEAFKADVATMHFSLNQWGNQAMPQDFYALQEVRSGIQEDMQESKAVKISAEHVLKKDLNRLLDQWI
jgi:hypothetical protein